jgi:hypothetical protein
MTNWNNQSEQPRTESHANPQLLVSEVSLMNASLERQLWGDRSDLAASHNLDYKNLRVTRSIETKFLNYIEVMLGMREAKALVCCSRD